jgi:membrane associated rhomboid family serine protease
VLPIGDSPNPPGTPLVNYALVAANVAVFVLVALPLSGVAADPHDPLLREYVQAIAQQYGGRVPLREILSQVSAYDLVVFRYGYRPASPSIVALFTSLFLHAGFAHLAGNMLFLWIYGDNVEYRLGRLRYLGAYLLSGVVATLAHALFAARSSLPLVGASGAISGVLGFYFVWFPRNRVQILLFFPFLARVSVPARALLALYIIVENLLPFLFSRGVAGIAHGAHIGGFIAGALLAWTGDRRLLGTPGAVASQRADGPPATDLASALANGDYAAAARAYFALPAGQDRRVLAPRESIALANWLQQQGQDRAALVVYRRHVRDYPRGPLLAEAHLGAGLVQLYGFGQATAAYQHFLAVLELEADPAVQAQAREALATIGSRQRRPRPLAG